MRFKPQRGIVCRGRSLFRLLFLASSMVACSESPPPSPTAPKSDVTATVPEGNPRQRTVPPSFVQTGSVAEAALDEISGIQAGNGADWWVHTDDGRPQVYAIGTDGNLETGVALNGALNRDWEDMTRAPGPDGPLLVISDSGDNEGTRKRIQLYFYPMPVRDSTGRLPASLELQHRINLRYPDGPRDCESAAFEPVDQRILLVTKRDIPPRIYGIRLDLALSAADAELEFLGETARLRPPTPVDLIREPSRGAWISQPTGMDISPDGRIAAVITNRSLYLFRRETGETWRDALARTPLEIEGPPGYHEEAVSFSRDGERVMVLSETLPAPVYQLDVRGVFPD